MTIQQQQPEQLTEQPQTKVPGEVPAQERWPLIEIFTEGDKLVVTADLPGILAEDLTVRISERELRLLGERRRASEDGSDRQYYEQEQHYGPFERVIKLPKRVKTQSLTVHIENGLLTLQAEVAE